MADYSAFLASQRREWTGSGQYVSGFDAGFHAFTDPDEAALSEDYILGRKDGEHTRQIFDAQDHQPPTPALFFRPARD